MRVSSTFVTAKVKVPGYHYWPDAHPHRKYLRSEHRHLFTINVGVSVDRSRGVEFHDLQEAIREALFDIYPKRDNDGFLFADQSCEDIALTLGTRLCDSLPVVYVEVSEDDENSATITISDKEQ